MSTPSISYEDISSIDIGKSVNLAEDVIKNGWGKRNYPVILLSQKIPWALSTQDERSWNFYIHCWDMLDSLLKAHSQTNDTKYLKPAINIAKDWAEKHSQYLLDENMSPFAWYDMAVGLRAYRLAYIIDAGIHATLLDKSCRQLLWNTLLKHQAYLADNSNIAFHNNHGYYQIAGQIAMGRRFAEQSPVMAEAREQGSERLKYMLKQQFADDGVHREHSPDYHRMVYVTLKALIDCGLVDDEDIISFAEKIENALSWFVLPDQHIANFGDSDFRFLRLNSEEAERKWQTPEMRYVVSGGKIGHLPDQRVAAFSEGGYFVVRQPSDDEPTDFSRSSYLAQLAAFHSRTHKHADDLSFIWSDRGSNLLIDAGRFGYIGKTEQESELWKDGHWYSDPYRIYCESTRAHNTLEFNNKNCPRKGVKPYGSALTRWIEKENGLVAVETECKHFKSIRRSRVLIFMPGQWLLVCDWFKDNHDGKHDVRQWFHFAPELQLTPDEDGYLSVIPGSAEPLCVASLLQGPQFSPLLIGEKAPQLQGWFSPKEREIVPAYALSLDLYGVTQGNFATLITFSKGLKTDHQASRINVSGRQGRFVWQDERGNHEVRLFRPKQGDFNVDYVLKPV